MILNLLLTCASFLLDSLTFQPAFQPQPQLECSPSSILFSPVSTTSFNSLMSNIVTVSDSSVPLEDVPAPTRQTFHYSIVPGLFRQDESDFDPAKEYDRHGMLEHFGLLDRTWTQLTQYVQDLQNSREEGEGVIYKLIYIIRHGQGYHNFAEKKYGTQAWDAYWSKLDGDGEISWVDAQLTPLGIDQATHLSRSLQVETKEFKMPIPSLLWVSPLQRALHTCQIAWGDVAAAPQGTMSIVKETLREVIGVHTCDKRSNKSTIASLYPSFSFVLPFTETDELWSPNDRETKEDEEIRLKNALDDIFSFLSEKISLKIKNKAGTLEEKERERDQVQVEDEYDCGDQVISIVGHNGMANAIFRVIGHQEREIPTGGLVPVLVKAVAQHLE